MSRVFLELLNISITASYLILVVIFLRLVMKKAPKWTVCLLWGTVAIRLIFPFHLESTLSLIPSSKPILMETEYSRTPTINTEISTVNNAINPDTSESISPDIAVSVDPLQIIIDIISVIWFAGVIALFIYAVFSFVRLKQKVAPSIQLYGNIYLCDEADSPFILGIVKPRIYLPSGIERVAQNSILTHEEAHIRRGDHFWKPLGYMILSVYWFHPLCWAAYFLFCKDMELACDEKATKDMDKDARADYCQALLKCSVSRRMITVCPVAFGEVGVKSRIKSVLTYKKPTFWIIALAILVCAVVSICFLTNPKSDFSAQENTTEETATVETATEETATVETATEETATVETATEETTTEETITENSEGHTDENGYHWLSEDVFTYEFGDLDGNGIVEYVKVNLATELPDYECHFTFYWNGNAIYEYDDACRISPGNAEYLDLDGDGEKEIFFPFYPWVNSMPLEEYIVLKQIDGSWKPLEMIHGETMMDNAFPLSITKGNTKWQAVISCERLEKEVIYDMELHYLDLKSGLENGEENGFIKELIAHYDNDFVDYPTGETCGYVSAWGIWGIKAGEYDGQPCLIATHGIEGFDKSDFWGVADVYFDYDAQGKTRFLDIQFRPQYTYLEQN